MLFHSHETILEVAFEFSRFTSLDLPVLNRTAAEILVQLGHIDGCCSLLILRGSVAYPVVDVNGLCGAVAHLNDTGQNA